jgi:DNA-binding transcriptional LysR family regulator
MADIKNPNTGAALPPLATLPAFEAAARFGSFSKAARELNSSQPAISLQIRQLEQAVGHKLFRRKSQGVVVTEAGAELLVAVQVGLSALREAMERLRQPGLRSDLTVATDFAFAAYWLLPRLDRFKAEMPLVDVRILTAQHVDDLGGANADLAILFGAAPAAPDLPDEFRLFAETIQPVCAPAYATAHPGTNWLSEATLLHLDDVAAGPQQPQRHGLRWFHWNDWLKAAGLNLPPRGPQLRFNNYTLALQAAIAGQGVALGWSPLVEPLVAAGQLVPAHDFVLRSPRGYVARLLRQEVQAGFNVGAGGSLPIQPGSADRAETAPAQHFLAWLRREASLAS